MPKQIYIVISQSGSIVSRILRLVTGAEYNHASISLSPDLNTMYSFGRVHPYNPFWGGFVKESPYRGTFKRFSSAKAVVLSVNVSEEQYRAIHARLNEMFSEKERYHYNYAGLFLAGIHVHYRRARYYYCSEFIKDLLARYGIPGAMQMEPIVKPIDFLELPNTTRVYCGKLANYSISA